MLCQALSGSKLSADDKISQQQMKSSAIDGKYFNKQLPDYRNLDAIVYNFISLLLQEDIAYTRLLCFSTGPPPPQKGTVANSKNPDEMQHKAIYHGMFYVTLYMGHFRPCGII